MSYPQGDPSNQGFTGGDFGAGQTDHSAQSGFTGGAYGAQSGYGAQPGYGVQPGYPGQSLYAQNPSARPGPPSNVGWAVASIIFFWPLSFVAMTRALDVYPLWAAGRHEESEAASNTAKKLGMISIAILVVLFALYMVFIFAMVGLAASTGY